MTAALDGRGTVFRLLEEALNPVNDESNDMEVVMLKPLGRAGRWLALSACIWVRAALAQSPVYFHDDFDGPQIDSSKWRAEDATEGFRWCDPNAGPQDGPGSWLNPATESCFGVAVSPPYGTLMLDSGLVGLGPGASSRTFAFLASRLPGGVAPFPANGDFSLTFRMRYDHRGAWGDGVNVMKWDDTTPSGANSPGQHCCCVLSVWADPSIRIFTSVRGFFEEVPISVSDPDAFHVFEARYERGAYSFLIDGDVVFGPASSVLRPTAIWMGNPVVAYWGAGGWSTFSVDYVRVTADAPIPVAPWTWGQLKARYR